MTVQITQTVSTPTPLLLFWLLPEEYHYISRNEFYKDIPFLFPPSPPRRDHNSRPSPLPQTLSMHFRTQVRRKVHIFVYYHGNEWPVSICYRECPRHSLFLRKKRVVTVSSKYLNCLLHVIIFMCSKYMGVVSNTTWKYEQHKYRNWQFLTRHTCGRKRGSFVWRHVQKVYETQRHVCFQGGWGKGGNRPRQAVC